MYEVSYNGRTSYMRNYFYCHIRLLYDAECDLLSIAVEISVQLVSK